MNIEDSNVLDGDFDDADCRSMTVSDSDLTCTTFNDAKFGKTKMVNTILANADFDIKTNIKNCEFLNCDLQGVDLTGCDLTGTELRDSKLTGSFQNSTLDWCYFNSSNLDTASVSHASARGAMFTDATLTETEFRHCDVTGANFSGASAFNADFTGTDLETALHQPNI